MRIVRGFTLVEVLVALAVLSVALLAWTQLQGRAAQAERTASVRRELAAWMRSELSLQRSVRANDCRSRAAPAGWRCTVVRVCVGGAAPCDTETVRVTITPAAGPPLTGTTAVWWPLQRAPVGSQP